MLRLDGIFLLELLTPQGVLESDWKYLYVPHFRKEILLKMDTAGHIIKEINIGKYLKHYWKDNWVLQYGGDPEEYMLEIELPYIRGSFGRYFIYYHEEDSTKICDLLTNLIWKAGFHFYPFGMDIRGNIYGYVYERHEKPIVVKVTPQGEAIKYGTIRFSGTGFACHTIVTPGGILYNLEWVFDELKNVKKLRVWRYCLN